jgi:hypothetical protein
MRRTNPGQVGSVLPHPREYAHPPQVADRGSGHSRPLRSTKRGTASVRRWDNYSRVTVGRPGRERPLAEAASEGSGGLDPFVEALNLGNEPVKFCGEHGVGQALGKHVRQ